MVSKLCRMLFMLLVGFGYSVSAQETTHLPPGPLKKGNILVARSDYPQDHLQNITELWLLDPFSGKEKLYLNVEREGYRIRDISLAREGKYLFTLEIEGRKDTGYVPLGPSELFRMNLETGDRNLLFSGSNLTNFMLSANSEKALVRFYPEEMTFVDRYDLVLREKWCVIELSVINPDECRQLIFERDAYPDAFEWLSDDILAYTLNSEASIQILDTATFSTSVIELPTGVYVGQIRAVPNSADLLVYDSPLQGEIGSLYLLDTSIKRFREVSELDYPPMDIVEISPDGSQVAMAGIGNMGILINLQTGEIIQRYPTIYDLRWTSLYWVTTDRHHFLLGSMGYNNGSIATVLLEPTLNTAVHIIRSPDGKLIVVR